MPEPARRVLLIDDEPSIIKVVGKRLEREGFEVLIALDGQDGLTKAQTQHPDLIILDLMLPKRSGFEICATLKQDPQSSAIPIVIYTARGQETDKLCEACGADATVHKSASIPDDLIARVKALLDRKP